jgi:AcrR family transcriptional regulator
MEQVAAEARVALKTVYVAFTTKSGLLRALWDLRLKGDQDQAAVADRPWYREVVDEPDPERQLRRNAGNARLVRQRIGGVLKILRSAAPVDSDAEAL